FLVAVAITFLFALPAESLGLSAVVGAFLAGSVFANTTLQEDFSRAARPLAAVFPPIFFVSLGLQVAFPAVAPQFGLIPLAMRRPERRNSRKRSRGTARATTISRSRHAVWYVKPISQAALPHRSGAEPYSPSRACRIDSRPRSLN